jgi:hypothetical protein
MSWLRKTYESPWMPAARFCAKWLGVATLLAAVLLITLEIIRPWEVPMR